MYIQIQIVLDTRYDIICFDTVAQIIQMNSQGIELVDENGIHEQ